MRFFRLSLFGIAAFTLLIQPVLAQRTATATATVINGFVVAVTVTDPGEGYINPPNVTITGGGGNGATATATLSGRGVGSISVTSAGIGYTSVPAVVIEAPPKPLTPTLAIDLVPKITVDGQPGSTNTIAWAPTVDGPWTIWTNCVIGSSAVTLVDLTPGAKTRFYRAMPQSGPTGFVWIPPGTFVMGSPVTEQHRSADEGPQTVVTLSHGFFMGTREVTQGEYQALMGNNPSLFTGEPNRPVERVSWTAAVNYCVKLTEQELTARRLALGWIYRLPTEAEWEYAARAGSTNRFSFGDDPDYSLLGDYAWFVNNSDNQTHAVASKRPNRWGLYDMNGNVWEWCSDWYWMYPGGNATDPQGVVPGTTRIIRGGAWAYDAYRCRSAQRLADQPFSGTKSVGFRVVLAPGQ